MFKKLSRIRIISKTNLKTSRKHLSEFKKILTSKNSSNCKRIFFIKFKEVDPKTLPIEFH